MVRERSVALATVPVRVSGYEAAILEGAMKDARLSEDAAFALEGAAELARKMRHGEVTSLHLLAVLLGPDGRALWGGMLGSAVTRRELELLVRARLDAIPATGGYRDTNAVVPRSAELAALLASFRPGVVFAPIVELNELLHAMLDRDPVDAMVRRARLDLEHLDLALESATRLAFSQKLAAVHPEHVLAVLAEHEWFSKVIDAVGGSVARVKEAITTPAGQTQRAPFGPPFPTAELNLLVTHAATYARVQRRPLSADLFLLRALYDEKVQAIFAAAGIDHFDLIRALIDARDDDEAPTDVVFHDDARTSVAFVLDMLQGVFGHSDSAARQLAADIEREGHAVAATLPRTDAHEIAQSIMRRAREAGFPLLVTLKLARS